LQNSEGRLIRYVRLLLLAARSTGSFVPKWGLPRTDSFLKLTAHSLDGAGRAYVVVELRESRKDRLEEPALRLSINRLRHRHHLDAVFHQRGFYIEVIAYVARETIHLPDEQLLNSVFADLAIGKHLDQLRAVREFRGLAAIYEHLHNFKVISVRIIPARDFLRFKAGSFHLLF
jgi:hypothetical protein